MITTLDMSWLDLSGGSWAKESPGRYVSPSGVGLACAYEESVGMFNLMWALMGGPTVDEYQRKQLWQPPLALAQRYSWVMSAYHQELYLRLATVGTGGVSEWHVVNEAGKNGMKDYITFLNDSFVSVLRPYTGLDLRAELLSTYNKVYKEH